MILDKVIIVACCLAAVGCALQVDKDNNKNDHKEATRTARNVFLPPYNNGLFYNSPWNWNNNYYNNYNPYRSYPYPLAHYRYPGAAVAAAPVGPVAAVATGAVNPNDYRSPVLYSNDIRHPDGSYYYEYETANGIRRLENSVQTPDDNVVRGSYSHVGPDGRTYTVNYVADKNGYRASGDHLPQQPQQQAPLNGHPILQTPKPIVVGGTPAKPLATAFPAFDYRHPAAFLHPNHVYVSPYQPFSTVRPFLGK